MDFMSVLFGIGVKYSAELLAGLIHHSDEIIKQGFHVMWSGTRFGMPLKAHGGTIRPFNPLQTAVK
jgi:hypothetical protein